MSKYAIKTKPEYLLSEESAIEQVVDLVTYYDIDVEKISDEKSREAFEKMLDNLTENIRLGTLEITREKDNKMVVVQHLSGGDSLRYGELGAKHKLAMDRVPRDEQYKRIYALMGSLCGLGSTVIEKLPVKDLSLVEVLGTVFSNA